MKGVLQALGLLLFYAVILFGAAGRIFWLEGWLFLGLYGGFTVAALLVLDPELIRERGSAAPGIQPEDVRLASLGALFLYPVSFAVAGVDARLGASHVPAVGVVLGLLVFGVGHAFALRAMQVNRFFSTFVRIQQDRGHRVISEGPYRLVRHPGYAGALLSELALPLALGSWWAYLPALLGTAIFVARTAREDRTLHAELEGYAAYAGRVPWKLVPGVW